ncbi:MAG: hypothetical protein SGI88_18920 [Candidatus Hydrogenedentes bacterium]|nr:hypothetical protein [Candidatus Hydrogenedentota bacterium]
MLSITDQIIASATTFLTGAVIARLCAKEEFGLYALGFSLLALLMTLQSSLITTPLMIGMPRLAGDSLRRFSGSSLLHQGVFGIAATIAVLIAAACVSAWNPSLGVTLAAVGAVLSFLLLRDYIRQACFARLAFGQALVSDIALALLQIGALGLLVFTGTLNAASAFIAFGISCAISSAFWLARTRSERIVEPGVAVIDFQRTWSSGKWLVASGLVWAVSMNLYAWIVAAFHGTASAGVWAAAFGVMTLVNPLMLGIQNFLGPRILHALPLGGISMLSRVVRDSAVVFCAALLVFSMCMWFFGDALIANIYGAKYAGNGLLVFVLALNASVLTVGFAVSRGLFALELAHTDFYVNLIAFVCFLALGVAFVRVAGPLGAAIAQLLTNAVASGARVLVFARHTRLAGAAA